MLSLNQHFSCVRELQYRMKLQLQYIIYFIFFIQKKSPTLLNSWSCAYLDLSVIEAGPALGLRARCSLTRSPADSCV